MSPLTKDSIREIIDDFAKDIARRKSEGPKPTTAIIDFRTEKRDRVERKVWLVPIELLRFRKDNGRIASDVISHEKTSGVLDESGEGGQKKLKEFLENKDSEKTEDLKKSIMHQDQTEAAIITCDGFLINGNRRKMVMELLKEKTREARFDYMKVVILPGKEELGGPPTLKEIEQIENRYQLQRDTKAEYSGLDTALSIRRKRDCGMSLLEQIKDDPVHAGLDSKELTKKVKEYEEHFLKPLDCADRYLANFGREGHYFLISEGVSDREGRWQAFLDYYQSVGKKLEDREERAKLGVGDYEVGKLEDVAFKIIRKREFQEIGISKVHKMMRDFPKWIKEKDAKKELLELAKLPATLPEESSKKQDGTTFSPKEIDKQWAAQHHQEFMHRIKKTINYFELKKSKEGPLELLDQTLKKLEHDNMNMDQIRLQDLQLAINLLSNIESQAKELRKECYELEKNAEKLTAQHKSR